MVVVYNTDTHDVSSIIALLLSLIDKCPWITYAISKDASTTLLFTFILLFCCYFLLKYFLSYFACFWTICTPVFLSMTDTKFYQLLRSSLSLQSFLSHALLKFLYATDKSVIMSLFCYYWYHHHLNL